MSCKHPTPPPQSQRDCLEPSSKAKIPTFFSFPFLDKFEKKSFVKVKLKIPPAYPSPPFNSTHFYCFFFFFAGGRGDPTTKTHT